MRLASIDVSRYRSIRSARIELGALNLFIGANASGKSNILDSLRFLSDGLLTRGFETAVNDRGGILALAWKGERAQEVQLRALFEDGQRRFEWTVGLRTPGYGFDFVVEEQVAEVFGDKPPEQLLDVSKGRGWWWSPESQSKVRVAQTETACSLAAAAVDESFPARGLAEFVTRWSFFDPSPPMLRRSARIEDSRRLDPSGSNLAARLRALQLEAPSSFERILEATQHVLGVPKGIEIRESDGRVHFVQDEPGLEFKVHQVGASSGTLRMLALMTGLLGEDQATLVGIEEPENHVHPTALEAFAEYVRAASERRQVMITTHSPLLLDALAAPETVAVVRRTHQGTAVQRETSPDAVRRALDESGFGLGELHQTKGFGA